jgi:two-component system sensor histidine kinase ChiS
MVVEFGLRIMIKVMKELPINSDKLNNQVQKNGAALITNKATRQKTTILIIDDEEACLTSMELLLKSTNCNLIKASSGLEGLEYLKDNPNTIDLVLLDLMMPDIYGLEVLERIKNDKTLTKIPVFLQSGTSDQPEIERAFKLGIAGYIKKPYKKNIIIEEISKTLLE